VSTPVPEASARHESSLKRFIERFPRSTFDLEGIAQEAFLRACAVERTRPIEQPKSLLFRIAKHVARSQLTREARQIADYIEDFEASAVIRVEHLSQNEISARFTPQCRKVHLPRKVHGFSHEEIASQLGIAVSTVENHLIRAVEQCERYVREKANAQRGPEPSLVSHGRRRGRS
jgi:RNA polymerase sigma-70 factor (ECF subfamily)